MIILQLLIRIDSFKDHLNHRNYISSPSILISIKGINVDDVKISFIENYFTSISLWNQEIT
jgi:hypothetical protein